MLAAGDAAGPGFASRPENISHLIYTSGTSGRPKGVARSHLGALAYADCMVRDMWLSLDTGYLVLAPMFHMGGGIRVAAVHQQAGLCVMEHQFDPVRTLELIE